MENSHVSSTLFVLCFDLLGPVSRAPFLPIGTLGISSTIAPTINSLQKTYLPQHRNLDKAQSDIYEQLALRVLAFGVLFI